MEKFLNAVRGYKTVFVNVFVAAGAILIAISPDLQWVDAEEAGANFDAIVAGLAAAFALVNVVLRAVTSTKIFSGNERGE